MATQYLPEDLSKPAITATEVQQIWAQRRSRMQLRRKYFEPIWQSAMASYYSGIFPDINQTGNNLYNPIYEQYDMTLYSRDGFRFLRMKMPIIHDVIIRKLASEVPNKPKVNFVSAGSNDPTKAIAFKHWFNQFLYDMDADQEDFEVFLGKDILGTSAVMVMTDEYEVAVKDENNKPVDKKKVKKTYYRNIDLRHLLLDEHCTKCNLSDCNYAGVDEYYSKQEFVQKFAKYGIDKVMAASESAVMQAEGSAYTDLFGGDTVPFVRVTRYFDRISDSYHLIANDVLLNDVHTAIPRVARTQGKEIPIALAIDFKMPGSPYGYSSAHVSALFNRIKNLIRQILFEVTEKQAKPILAVDPMSSFDEETFEWNQEFMRIKPDDIKPIQINFDTIALTNLDKTTDEDIIRATGINFNDTSNIDAGETARKTIIRRESQNAIVELGMNYNASVYFKRLYELMKDEILFHWKDLVSQGETKVRTKNVQLGRGTDGALFEEPAPVEGFRYFKLTNDDLSSDYELYLELANIASSRELEKAVLSEQLNAIQPFVQNFDAAGLAEYVRTTFKMPDSVLPGGNKDMSQMPVEKLAQEGLGSEYLPQEVLRKNQLDTTNLQNPNAPLPDNQAAQAGA